MGQRGLPPTNPPSLQCPTARRRGDVHPTAPCTAALRPPSLAAPASSIAPAPSPSAPPAASLSNLINSPQGDPLPPAAGPQAEPPGDAARGQGDPARSRGTPSPRLGARQPCAARRPGPQGTGGAPRALQGHPCKPPAPQPCSPEPRSPLGPRSTPRLALCLCTQSLRASPAVGSSKALPLLNSSIIDIVAEPPGAGGWQRYYLHLSSFPSPPPFPGRLKSREIRRRKAASSSSPAPWRGGISQTSRSPSPHPPQPALPVPVPVPPPLWAAELLGGGGQGATAGSTQG